MVDEKDDDKKANETDAQTAREKQKLSAAVLSAIVSDTLKVLACFAFLAKLFLTDAVAAICQSRRAASS